MIGYRMFKGGRGIHNSDVIRKDGKGRMGKITVSRMFLVSANFG